MEVRLPLRMERPGKLTRILLKLSLLTICQTKDSARCSYNASDPPISNPHLPHCFLLRPASHHTRLRGYRNASSTDREYPRTTSTFLYRTNSIPGTPYHVDKRASTTSGKCLRHAPYVTADDHKCHTTVADKQGTALRVEARKRKDRRGQDIYRTRRLG